MLFLDQRAHALAAATLASNSIPTTKASPKVIPKSKIRSVHHGTVAATKCHQCKGDHSLYKCDVFLKLSAADRQASIKNLRLCFNCLRAGHHSQQCSGGRCRTCNGRHHALIHLDTVPTSDQSSQISVTNHHFNKSNNGLVLLSTALVNVKGADGNWHIFRALLDSGSQASLVTENCVQKLGHRKIKTNVSITGVSSQGVVTSHGSVQLTLSSVHQPNDNFNIDALILTKITSPQPTTNIDVEKHTHYKFLPLADPQFFIPGQIDILLGADVYADLLLSGICKGPIGSPTAFETTLGWILTGKLSEPVQRSISSHHVQCITDAEIHRFWEVEEDTPTKFMTPEEIACEQHFISTHTRDSSGRFTTRLPFRPDALELGVSREVAIRRLKSLERRLAGFPDQQLQYRTFMKEYIDLGHMEPVPCDEVLFPHQVYYMPHHAVFKPSSTSTKLRVVFDASAKSSTGVSLNDRLMVGPKVQDDIVPLVLRFRRHAIAMTADVAKMYRQVNVDRSDSNFQRIVWRENETRPIQDFRLLTVTYGTSSAPYQATRCLRQLAEDEEQTWPLAAAVLSKDFYVDDLLSGADSESEALQLQSDLIQLLAKGGFRLCKWSSNSSALLSAVPPESRETSLPLHICEDQGVKALGIRWHPGLDCFSFVAPLLEHRGAITKRTLLSDLAKLYDPLGWLSPTTIQSKLLFQSLWKHDLEWDQPVPEMYREQWIHYQQGLPNIQQINIQRCIMLPKSSEHQLHAFCDASLRAFAAVVYLRSTSGSSTKISLIASRTKVAPLKTQSLPRLELCGAVLLSRIVKLVYRSLNLSCDIHAYSDSTIVLAWLSSSPSRWKTFIANRVSEVQMNLPGTQWHHVSTSQNPADCATRGISPLELVTHELWWEGPKFLQLPKLPVFSSNPHVSADLLESEQKGTLVTLHVNHDLSMLHSYSSLGKLQRITAWCMRFISNSKARNQNRKFGNLSTVELQQALLRWIKIIQGDHFYMDINQLKCKLPLTAKSQLLCLNPFLDNFGLLRVGGRLSNSNLPEGQKHPLVLPSRHILTKLIITDAHIKGLHAGPQLMLTMLRTQFWILSGRDAVRNVFRRCVTCQRHQAASAQQMMGELPSARVIPSRPFSHCGVDYAGPILLRVLKGRGHKTFKGYISLFVCFATRAIHLELISDLTTAAFIAGLKRFIARRGKPTSMHSDCGTNFIGADRELRKFQKQAKGSEHNSSVSHYLTDLGIDWVFNPPAAPHFGGLWEAGVKSVKYHLKRIVGNAVLNFEEMNTVLSQIEACLNSRPLSALSSSPSDFAALTPGHFLIGGPLTAISEPNFVQSKINRLNRWQYSQQLVQHFWQRWSSEYLSRLQRRPKWWLKKENLQIGDLVLIKDETLPPLKWKLGRITHLHPGKDGLVRTVSIKTACGELKRPVVKLSPLPMDKDC